MPRDSISSCRSLELIPRLSVSLADIRQHNMVSGKEGFGDLPQEFFGAGEGMGLEHTPEGFVGIIPRSL